MSTEQGKEQHKFWPWLMDNGIVLGVGAYAYIGSLSHWLTLAARYGQAGSAGWAVAGVVDLCAIAATVERQRDLRIGREPKGWVSWPFIVMAITMLGTLVANAFTAPPNAGGIILAISPAVVFLIVISLVERRAAERLRRWKAAQAERDAETARAKALRQKEDERLSALREEAERERLRLEAAERERELARQAERERQEEADRKRHERDRQARERHERQAAFAEQRHGGASQDGASVTGGAPASVMAAAMGAGPGGLAVLPPAEAGARTPERRAMWGHWVRVIKTERRIPAGPELLKAGGCNPGSSLGRQMVTRWQQIEPARSLIAEQERSRAAGDGAPVAGGAQ